MRYEDKVELVAFVAIITLLTMVAWDSYLSPYYYSIGSAMVCMIIATIPPALRRLQVITLPLWMTGWLYITLFLHSFGIFQGWYSQLYWYDELTHSLASGLGASLIFLLLVLMSEHSTRVRISSPFYPLIMITFMMGLGIIWEVVEYLLDIVTVAVIQYSLLDTITDLMTDLAACAAASAICLAQLYFMDVKEVSQSLHAERLIKRYQLKYQDRA